MIIPYQQLDPETLNALLEEFITREGTEYGAREISLASKVEQLRVQLVRREIAIVFDPVVETTSLVAARDLKAMGLTL